MIFLSASTVKLPASGSRIKAEVINGPTPELCNADGGRCLLRHSHHSSGDEYRNCLLTWRDYGGNEIVSCVDLRGGRESRQVGGDMCLNLGTMSSHLGAMLERRTASEQARRRSQAGTTPCSHMPQVCQQSGSRDAKFPHHRAFSRLSRRAQAAGIENKPDSSNCGTQSETVSTPRCKVKVRRSCTYQRLAIASFCCLPFRCGIDMRSLCVQNAELLEHERDSSTPKHRSA